MKVCEIMTSHVHTISSDRSVFRASQMMNERDVGSLIVVDYGEIVGIITSRDIRSSHPNRIVADAMTQQPVGIAPDVFIWDALNIMDRHRFERLLILEDGKLVGLVTRESIRMKLSELQDPLSGLYRAPYIQSVGEALLARRQPFHLLFIDLNRFGEINKRYGHPFGDDVIREFAGRMTAMTVAERDFLCRYAGDEFVMITLSNEAEIEHCIHLFSEPFLINNIAVSAAIGHIDALSQDTSAMSFRDLLSQASLLSTRSKPVAR